MRTISTWVAVSWLATGCFSESDDPDDGGAMATSAGASTDGDATTGTASVDDTTGGEGPEETCNGLDDDDDGAIDEGDVCPALCEGLQGATSRYLVCTQAVDFAGATQVCGNLGGDLVSIESATENGLIAGKIADVTGQDIVTLWAGGSDTRTAGTWVWQATGETFWVGDATGMAPAGQFTNWLFGEPNNFNDDEHCLGIAGNALWNDMGCSATQGYVCELDG